MTAPTPDRHDTGLPFLKRILNLLGVAALGNELLIQDQPNWIVIVASGALVGLISLDTIDSIVRSYGRRSGGGDTPPKGTDL